MTQTGSFQVSGDSPSIFSTLIIQKADIYLSMNLFFIVSSSYSCSFSALCDNEYCIPAISARHLLPGREHQLPCKTGHHHARGAGCGHHHLHYHYRESRFHSSPIILPMISSSLESHADPQQSVRSWFCTEEGLIMHNNTAFCAHELV